MTAKPGKNGLRLAIDRGGTFTDVYANNNGQEIIIKLLSEDPQNYPDAPREGIRRVLLQIPELDDTLPSALSFIDHIRMGTTVATNALLERKGARTALIITKGFKDLLKIGYQNRPDLFDLRIDRPDILYDTVIEVDERIRPATPSDPEENRIPGISGEHFICLRAPDSEVVRQDLQKIYDQDITSIAIVFLHSYSCPKHEQLVESIAKEIGFQQISVSSHITPRIKIVPRGDTTVVDAYLTPQIQCYLNGFTSDFLSEFPRHKIHFMQSDGGLSPADTFRGSNAILSGPAGGVVGYALTTFSENEGRPVIGFDMGGTSTDVSRFAGDFEIIHEGETAGVRMQCPQININTVAAGGGSRLMFKDNVMTVGPESSGAQPGPVCYRKNGFLSITDANLLLGRIQAAYFPKIFGETQSLPLDLDGVENEFEKICTIINQSYPGAKSTLDMYQVAAGFIEIANHTMARAIREISVMRGFDSKDHVLACFGGAGGQHACAIAKMLGIREIFIHRHSGILSAYGIELADSAVEGSEPAAMVFSLESLPLIKEQFQRLYNSSLKELKSQGFNKDQTSKHYYLNMRYEGTDTQLMVSLPDDWDFAKAFIQQHRREFGFALENRKIWIDDFRVRVLGHPSSLLRQRLEKHDLKVQPIEVISCYFDGEWHDTPTYILDTIGSGFSIQGPALLISKTATIVVEPFCTLRVNSYGDITIHVTGKRLHSKTAQVDPIQLAVFSNLFMSIAEQMGRTLQRTSISTNIKERLDFSCALFDNSGQLVANAPHIPVHLGSMGFAVKMQIELHGKTLKPGDVLVTNDPFFGGSHLPDITVITPVWFKNTIAYYVASRGHHADIGGLTPGSMPPFSQTLADEGVCITSFKLVEEHVFQERPIRSLLSTSRKIEDNVSDLKAQIAANQKGVTLLIDMTNDYGLECVHAYMNHINDSAERAVRSMLKTIAAEQANYSELVSTDKMDDGSKICLKITIDKVKGNAIFDFTGTGKHVSGNWNTPESVVYSSILYCLHSLSHTDLPLNQGCLRPIQVIIPEQSLLSPPPWFCSRWR